MIIKAKIKTNSNEFKIKEGAVWEISLKSPAKDNKANLELIKEMKKRYGFCKIIRGKSSKVKILEI
ncbi:MAG: DUF167 domain-containing protein [Nanoarchaeota archaeon]|nr:DUF167 domain-containing protein [Nanoarchaeota archaeon]